MRIRSIAKSGGKAHIQLIETEEFTMTKSFSTTVAALAISATLVAVTTPVSALETGTPRGVAAAGAGVLESVVGGGPISSGDQGSGRIADFTGMSSGSGR